jgi:FimV-like protein
VMAKAGDKTQAVSLLNKALKGGQLPPDQKAEAQALLNQLSK